MITDYLQSLWNELLHKSTSWWVMVGIVGQLFFGARYIVQWIASERQGRSVIPNSFWQLSLAGSLILLVYAIHIADPVFFLANLFTGLIFSRNIMLIRREKRPSREA
ncbi:MAG: lipid-A-disaccharide synthase N-terminal domain-containing protein [Candidatus Krumholzibacteria bacterium]|nr:lipid-A-disaccharide synthase N-terminal domain-containing protein [Candidatus Krumholzibacteria bacterium]